MLSNPSWGPQGSSNSSQAPVKPSLKTPVSDVATAVPQNPTWPFLVHRVLSRRRRQPAPCNGSHSWVSEHNFNQFLQMKMLITLQCLPPTWKHIYTHTHLPQTHCTLGNENKQKISSNTFLIHSPSSPKLPLQVDTRPHTTNHFIFLSRTRDLHQMVTFYWQKKVKTHSFSALNRNVGLDERRLAHFSRRVSEAASFLWSHRREKVRMEKTGRGGEDAFLQVKVFVGAT